MALTHQHTHFITTSIQKLSLVPLPFFSKVEGMEQVQSHKIEALVQSIKAQNHLIKLIQLLVSLSVFSFFISPSSLLAFLYHFNFYFSTFSFQLFTHTIDKNCMFLLCNGLLVFVGITKSLSGSSSVDESSKYVEDGSISQSPSSDVEANEPMLLVRKEVVEKNNEPDEQNSEAEHAMEINDSGEGEEKFGNITLEGEEEGKESREPVLKDEEEPNEKNELFGVGDEEKEPEIDEFLIGESVEEEPNCVLSTEELNKKFDDFIRRMKEDLRIEARRQLLMV